VLMMAAIMGVPNLIMDSNALPGFTNRRLARFIDKAALAFEAAVPFFGKKGVVTGNPVRKEFFNIAPRESAETVNLLIFGGSQGSRAINEAMAVTLPLLAGDKDRINVTHQTGDADYQIVADAYAANGWKDADIRPYIADMVTEVAKADLVISRAGATTCAELAAAGRASIMIPLPTAADDHQRKNAEAMQAEGASMMLLQSDLTGASLAAAIDELTGEPGQLVEMGRAAKSLGRADAAERTVDLIEELKRNA
ncbi:MAG TPA: UDP-N-acetylglucosamine--N-acetylmuramyl-(pentapeptide) pyrophosphoryl-undecaprenol N-acetylglucosamine transferase, partial [Pyrinomonadaceae bacterium]|nr:UDP-N-acetylglucosamine--N-acetylmuramyl-(pentapeptide) pyrophosphoryl-undecaprenol N-acetylglucosamine transferase [Pyrinomonadaceae bacterium]